MNELTGLLIGFILTLFIYSYVLGDNPLYHIAVHILVGVSAAYAAVVVGKQIIMPVYQTLRLEPFSRQSLLWLIPIFFSLLLIVRHIPALAWVGGSTLALLTGVGAAVALTGAIIGTLWPQVTIAKAQGQDAVTGLVIALLTVCTLFTFQFTGRANPEGEWVRPIWQRGFVQIGRAVLMITFGALFASVLGTSLVLLSDRVGYFLNQLVQQLP
ncbi:MAG: hypothetical protein ACE5E7_17580 [Anaerolineae bacterium]